MIDNNNILLVTDSNDVAKLITDKLVLLRKNDCITICDYSNIKKALNKSLYCVVILHQSETEEETIKAIENIKNLKLDSEVILLLDEKNPQLILKAYDKGVFDYFFTDTKDYEMLIKTVNCFKMRMLKDVQTRNEKFLYQLGVIDSKTNLYHHKYLKEIFIDISDNLRIQNGIFAIITLDEKTKTKVSTNRLALAIKNSVRADDIVSVARGGKFYLILPNIDLDGVKNLIDKIQDKMGNDFQIRAGLSKIGINQFETLEKNAQDGLISAIQNESGYECLEESVSGENSWLQEDNPNLSKKNYKLFKAIFDNKLNNVIIPVFFRHQKEYEVKLTNTEVSQYANDVESVFCLKNKNLRSELTIRYNGYTKFTADITHSGLDSAENTKKEIPLNAMTDRFLSSLLKQLKNEYKESLANK